jgi:predicted nucleic-acid-binding protein
MKSGVGGMSKALDTNIVVRFLVDDGSKEVPVSRAVFARETVEISTTVILECAWVLKSVYKIDRVEICDALTALLGMENVLVQNENLVEEAIEAHRLGVDLADALHLLAAEKSDEMLTFDDDFVKRAERVNGALPVRIPQLTA